MIKIFEHEGTYQDTAGIIALLVFFGVIGLVFFIWWIIRIIQLINGGNTVGGIITLVLGLFITPIIATPISYAFTATSKKSTTLEALEEELRIKELRERLLGGDKKPSNINTEIEELEAKLKKIELEKKIKAAEGK